MKTTREKILFLTYSAVIGAIYVALTWISNAFGLASMAVQVRLSEALCVLSFFTPAAPVGMFIGCLISNLTMGAPVLDVIFGSIATFLGAFIGRKMKNKWLVPIPIVISNTLIVPFVIIASYTKEWSIGAYALTALGVFAGEVVSAYIIGMPLLLALDKHDIFKKDK